MYIYTYIWKIHNTQDAQISQKQDRYNTYVIMKTMCLTGHQQNISVATQVLRHMMYVMYTEISHCISEPVGKGPLYIHV